MKDMDTIVNDLIADIEDIPADVPVVYEVWAIGYDEEDQATEAEMLIASFEDPDMAVSYAKAVTLADVVNLAADAYYEPDNHVHYISIEVETVVPDDEGTMNIGTVYKNTIEIFEELPEYVPLSADEYELLENGNIQIPCNILKEYDKNDCITVIFEDGDVSEPMIYKIISKTTSGYYVCEFV